MIKIIISIVFITVCAVQVIAQSEILKHNKALQKELIKAIGKEEESLCPLMLPDDLNEGVQGNYFLFNKPSGNKGYLYTGRVNSCRAGGCNQPTKQHDKTESEYFEYLMCWDSQLKVEYVGIYNYAATHGYEVTSKGWLKQFNGYMAGEILQVGKNIDAISGATISVYAITYEIQNKTMLLEEYLKTLENLSEKTEGSSVR